MSAFRRNLEKRNPNGIPSTPSFNSITAVHSSEASSTGTSTDLPPPHNRNETAFESDAITPPAPAPIKKRFTASWAQKRRYRDDEGARGPVGLRLLHSSPEPMIDLIFVHGLRGGSIKTWRKGSDPRFFWPQFWLPVEPGFRNVNIHSFGYESDWASTKPSILNVHDFGRSLLEEMRNSPFLKDTDRNGPIILIGHSMGGLVIKKAYILSRDTKELKSRIRCIFFLATPHRGSDYAAILNNILAVSGILTSRDYIRDLTTGSTSAQLINDDFAKYARDLPIFSFYETLRMSFGLSSSLIVEKSSAILGPGYKNERVQYLNANHRDICKFEGHDDPNYITLKNALRSAVEDLLSDASIARIEETTEQMKALKSYLGISARPDEYHQKVEGSCEWIDERDDFQDWRDSANDFLDEKAKSLAKNPSVIWVHANPGTGKTVLAAHVVSELQEFQAECAYYFFHTGTKAARSLAEFLRSIAYQMAVSNAAVRERLVKLCREGSPLDFDDDRMIWNKLFKRGIFQARVYTPQYWVVDAIDECNKYQEFFTMLKGEKPSFPLRIFLTSRNLPDIARLHRPLEASMSLALLEIPVASSMHDIDCYIQSRIDSLPLDSDSDRLELVASILNRSNACFLWVRLVLDELEQVYSTASILRVLQGIPEGMVPYYERTIKAMSENKMEKHIAQAVLLWVVASSRKITISELSQALKLDINEDLPSARNAVEGLCGQLVAVERQSGLVEVVHPTVQEFLLTDAAEEFCISKPIAHRRIALTCLQLLSGREMQPPRGRRFITQPRPTSSPFLDYAITQFSEHVYGASSENDDLLLAIDRFFRTNVLSWVERVAFRGDLHCLIRTSKNLRAYLDRRAKYHSPLSLQARNIDAWSIDLSRLVTKFGTTLLENPSSIYVLIPPLCPSDSAIFRQFGKKPDGLAVAGFKNTSWDDCIASVSFGEDRPITVSCGENHIAVGMASGSISLYNHQSCQKECILRNKWPIDIVHITDKFVVVSTIKSLVLQDTEGSTLWETRLRSRCILLTSSGSSIYAVSQHGHFLKWDMLDGTLLEDQSFEFRNHDAETDYNQLATRAPSVASISPDTEMLALAYRGGTVCLWDLVNGDFIGWARDDDDKLPAKMLFNPNPNINLLLIVYTNHDLAIFDSWSGTLVHSASPARDAGVLSASCSPNGRTFVTSDSLMNMQIWDFESLSLLYHLECPFAPFRLLHFTSDGSSIVDVTPSGMRVWSPVALIRKNIDEDASISEDLAPLAVTKGQYEPLRSSRITALCAHPSLPVVFAGKHNGQVIAFNTKTGQQIAVLYTHPQEDYVTLLAANGINTVASSDSNGVLQIWTLDPKRLSDAAGRTLLLQTKSREPVKQLCFSTHGNYLLVSSTLSDQVYSIQDGTCVGSLAFGPEDRNIWQWVPTLGAENDDQFMLFHKHRLEAFAADSFPSTIEEESDIINLSYELPEQDEETAVNSALLHAETRTFVVDIRHRSGYVSSSTTFLFDLKKEKKTLPRSNTETASTLVPLCELPPSICEHFIGISRRTKTQSFVFLHHNSWLSSTDLKRLTSKRYSQHFFVPNEYVPSSHETHHDVQPVITVDDDVVFCLYGELVVVKNGLRFEESKEWGVKSGGTSTAGMSKAPGNKEP